MNQSSQFAGLAAAGLNLQALFELHDLPAEVLDRLGVDTAAWNQLLLLGHAGPTLWRRLGDAERITSDADAHPIDDYSRAQVDALFAGELSGHGYRILYPGAEHVALQQLGELAGWHYSSPFRVGVCDHWGSWFAYRAVVLTDTRMEPFTTAVGGSACAGCTDRPCIAACSGQLLDRADSMAACIDFRLRPGSPCERRCAARWACPVAESARYTPAQFEYHYRRSLETLRAWATQAESACD